MDSKFSGQAHSLDVDWIESVYERFLNHESLDPSWKHFFEGYQLGQLDSNSSSYNSDISIGLKEKKAQFLCMIYRCYGYLQSEISPLVPSEESPLIREKLSKINLEEEVSSCGLLPQPFVKAKELIQVLKKHYCRGLSVETLACPPEIQEFVWKLMEGEKPHREPKKLLRCYKDLCKAVFFEEFLQVKFTGQKRFSLEGGEALIAMLEHMREFGVSIGIENYVLGMAHRGRLNVLTNVLSKPYRYVFMEFEDDPEARGLDAVGDVKYHKGYVSTTHLRDGREITLVLLPNPSHLETVDPVVEGVVAAMQHQGKSGEEKKTLAVLIHGDAAFSGQGVVYETFQLSQIPGYSTEGTLHIVINNHIGFTAHSRESRSTPYCTDIAKMLGIPVFRVNGEDVLACLEAMEHALKVRERFGCDVIIDFCCYRKYGHNESDDPSVTAPKLYDQIKTKASVQKLFKEFLQTHVPQISEKDLLLIENEVYDLLNREYQTLKEKNIECFPQKECLHCNRLQGGELIFHDLDVSLSLETLENLGARLCRIPEHFSPHPKVKALLDKRMKMVLGDIGCDWAMAEELAFASLLVEGFSLRLSGQDSIRGTFSQRHLLWSDIVTGDTHSPLYHLSSTQGAVEIYNSPLSEYAVLGFEYGYAQQAMKTLVAWEAQFGDFANGAQIIFDQYISSGVQKWDFHSDVVMLLPHGYEGQGPEHSSARIERYLQLAANWNFEVVLPSTPLQYFRILREHTLRDLSLPLVVFTPKMLLRHSQCTNFLKEFTLPGGFRSILEDDTPNYDAEILVMCMGKIYYDYKEALPEERHGDFACLRIESLYPLDFDGLVKLLDRYSKVKHYVWLQEEPQNMGAYEYMFMALKDILPGKMLCISRARSSSTASGSARLSHKELLTCMETLFSLR